MGPQYLNLSGKTNMKLWPNFKVDFSPDHLSFILKFDLGPLLLYWPEREFSSYFLLKSLLFYCCKRSLNQLLTHPSNYQSIHPPYFYFRDIHNYLIYFQYFDYLNLALSYHNFLAFISFGIGSQLFPTCLNNFIIFIQIHKCSTKIITSFWQYFFFY